MNAVYQLGLIKNTVLQRAPEDKEIPKNNLYDCLNSEVPNHRSGDQYQALDHFVSGHRERKYIYLERYFNFH